MYIVRQIIPNLWSIISKAETKILGRTYIQKGQSGGPQGTHHQLGFYVCYKTLCLGLRKGTKDFG